MPVPLVRQRHEWDCGVAAIAAVCGLSYEAVAAAVDADLVAERAGLYLEQLITIAAALGHRLERGRVVAGRVTVPADQAGIVGLLLDAGLADERAHWAVVFRGAIQCPQTGAIAPIREYLVAHRAEPFALLLVAA